MKTFFSKIFNKSHYGIEKFEYNEEKSIKEIISEQYGYNGDMVDFFLKNNKYTVHKWHHYIPLYDRYFSAFRGKKIKFLEIGVCKGGSLQMWRKYFGKEAIIYGIDIDSECKKFNGLAGQVRIGSQTDKIFLNSVLAEMGGVDIILDDGSHHMKHVSKSLKYLFPHLSKGGIYMIEDLHTAYWKSFGGGYNKKKNFFYFLMDLVHDLHHWYHERTLNHAEVSKSCTGIHIHDSIVVLEKNEVFKPCHSKIV
jgi:hypothetical protein